MEKVIKHIENYGFQAKSIINDKVKGYHFINNNSKSEFILDFTENNFKKVDSISNIYSKLIKDNLKIVYLIEVKDNIEEVMDIVEDGSFDDKLLLIYDKDDEIEFFLKDLWNIILALKN